jgi:hypothetical protein
MKSRGNLPYLILLNKMTFEKKKLHYYGYGSKSSDNEWPTKKIISLKQ